MNFWSKLRRYILWGLLILVSLFTLLIVLFYIPPVQDLIIKNALKIINTPEEFEITATKLRVSFPLTLEAENLEIIQNGDTTISVGDATIDADILPLLWKNVKAESLTVNDARYKTGKTDTITAIDAKLEAIKAEKITVDLSTMDISVERADAYTGDVKISIKNDTSTAIKDTITEPTKMIVALNKAGLHNIHTEISIENVADSIICNVPAVTLNNGTIDLGKQTIDAENISINGLYAKYVYPLETVPSPKKDEKPSAPWDININNISVTNSEAIYAAKSTIPQNGFDFNYIALNKIGINISNLHNCGSTVNVPNLKIEATERCGITLYADGDINIDSTKIAIDTLSFGSSFSKIGVKGVIGTGDFVNDKNLPIDITASAHVAQVDLKKMFPALAPVIASLPPYSVPTASVSVHGTTGNTVIDNITLRLPNHAELIAEGKITDILDPDKISGNVLLDGYIRNSEAIKGAFLSGEDAKNYAVPDISLNGDIDIKKGVYDGQLNGITETGDLAVDASIDYKHNNYSGDITLNTFPIQEFLPTMDLRDITAHITASASGIDRFDKNTTIKADVILDNITYNSKTYSDILLNALIYNGNIDVNFSSLNPDANFSLDISGIISPGPYDFDYSADIRNLNLKALELTENEGNIATDLSGHATLLPNSNKIDADITFSKLKCKILPSTDVNTTDINASLHSTDSTLAINFNNRDLNIKLNSHSSLSAFSKRLLAAVDTLNNHIERQKTDIESLQKTLPNFNLEIAARRDNIITSYLTGNNLKYNYFDLKISNDSLFTLNGNILELSGNRFAIDTTKIVMKQHGRYLTMKANLDSRPGTMDEWAHVEINGFLAGSKFGLFMRQANINNEIGYRLGTMANIEDSKLNISFVPYNPVIGYKEWNINDGNIITYDFHHKHIDADLLMTSKESLVHLFTQHNDSVHGQEDLNLKIQDIKIADWIALNPYAPKIKGDLSADLKVRFNENEQIEGKGTASISELYYGKQRVGTFDCGIDITTDRKGRIETTATMDIDRQRAMTAYGHISDSSAVVPFYADFELTRFPLKVINPFLPANTAKLSGVLNGQMDVTGSFEAPQFNGYLRFDSTELYVNMIGSKFKFDNINIPIDSNIVYFDNFDIRCINENPMTISGQVNMKNIFNPVINLDMTANNMQIVNSVRAAKGAEVYGKAFIDLKSKILGDLNKLKVSADLALLPQTNVTYVMTDAQSTIEAKQKSDMVRFVNLNDTSQRVSEPDVEPSTALEINAALSIKDGCTINADLSTDGKNKASLKCNGNLAYSMSAQGDDRMTGRLNITGGFARYTPPLMSEKLFTFSDGNYIVFNGDMLNPTIRLHAVDNLKANVTQEGQNSRLIEFDISLDVTGTLERMDVTFDLNTDDDITIQNELQSMSAEQRATQAMNLLLYNVYTGPGAKASSSLSANPLYTFLESQINSWAANNIKGVDISFGIDQYNKTTDGSQQLTTSYSYKVSKTLFNDRFKIVVGGNYSSDADSDAEIASSLLNDVSFEYSINPEGTMLVRIYRHTGFEDILEGEITQTGAGFVYKRKIMRLSDIFRPYKRKKDNAQK